MFIIMREDAPLKEGNLLQTWVKDMCPFGIIGKPPLLNKQRRAFKSSAETPRRKRPSYREGSPSTLGQYKLEVVVRA